MSGTIREAVEADHYRHPAWQREDLARWGWGRGDYMGGRCSKCSLRLPPHFKRAWHCAPCAAEAEWQAAGIAEALDAEYLPNKIAAAVEAEGE